MPVYLGLDIGSNSVGSAWVDTDRQEPHLAASVFPAGVDEQEDKRGAPKNQARRQTRSQRRNIARRAGRKRRLTRFLIGCRLLPADPKELQTLLDLNPWHLRRKGLSEPLSPFEFGRVVLHLAQRRGAVGVITDPDDDDEGVVKAGMDRLTQQIGAKTVGQFIADRMDQSRGPIERAPADRCSRGTRRRRGRQAKRWAQRGEQPPDPHYQAPIRNRQYRMAEDRFLFAGRELIRREFHRIVEAQRSFQDSELAALLTDELLCQLDNPAQTGAWRHQGFLFGQRRTYWDTGTLGRCVLEPTDRCVPVADRHACYYRVVETVNNIRIQRPGLEDRPLTAAERQKVIRLLQGPLFKKRKGSLEPKSSASVSDIKQVLGVNARDKSVRLNIEADEDREINTDWFHREIVHGAFTEERWRAMSDAQRESVNRAILKFDPDETKDADRLRDGAVQWWGLSPENAEKLVTAWRGRPKLEKRLNLSRLAILNLLPCMERFHEENNRWPTQQEARKAYAKVLQERFKQSGKEADRIAAQRYDTAAPGLTARARYYMGLEKHQIKQNGEVVRDTEGRPLALPPPAPMLSNPVVRKAIHEVRRHILAYLRKFRRKPDRVVIEFARGVKDTAKRRNLQLKANREREQERKLIEENLRGWGIAESNWDRAVLRVRLCREQNGVCPFSLQGANANRTIAEKMAAEGREVEIEHIVPEGMSGKTMAFNNLVLCFREANHGKGMRTPADWLGPDGVRAMLQRIENAPIRQNRVKWERLQAPTPDEQDFRSSQLTDTAYAARQVAAYIADALFDGQGLPERGGPRMIFTTKGEFTARLRADWGLHESTIDRAHGLEKPPSPEALTADPGLEQASRNARKESKDRTDHRHHAIDALAIALVGPELLEQVAQAAREAREYRDRTGYWPRRAAIDPPPAWTTPESFHQDVVSAFEKLIVSHRPVKRRIVGYLHKQTLYGPVFDHDGHRIENRATVRQPVYKSAQSHLTPAHLRLPSRETRDQALKRIIAELRDAGTKPRDARQRALSILDSPTFNPRLVEPPPRKSGLVRDLALRIVLRKCLEERGLKPDGFTGTELKAVLDRDGPLRHPSGVPIKSAVLLWANNDPVVLYRRKCKVADGQVEGDEDRRHRECEVRIYDSQNNHHVEIRKTANGQWTGKVIPAHAVTSRLAARLRAMSAIERPFRRLRRKVPESLGQGLSKEARRNLRSERSRANLAEWKRKMRELKPERSRVIAEHPIVDRSENDQGTFVMSLAEGEMIYARRWDPKQKQATGAPDYFVVCKLDKSGNSSRIHFAPHWDARKASEQDRWDVTPGDLKDCGPEPGKPPQKVRVDPLGNVVILEND